MMRSETSLLGSPATPTPSSAAQNYRPRTLLMHPLAWSSIRPTIPSRAREGRDSANATRRTVLLLFSKLSGFSIIISLYQRTCSASVRAGYSFSYSAISEGTVLRDPHTSPLLSTVNDSSNLIFRHLPATPAHTRTKKSEYLLCILVVLPLHCYSDQRVLFVSGHVSAFRSGREHAYSCLLCLPSISLLLLTFFSFLCFSSLLVVNCYISLI